MDRDPPTALIWTSASAACKARLWDLRGHGYSECGSGPLSFKNESETGSAG